MEMVQCAGTRLRGVDEVWAGIDGAAYILAPANAALLSKPKPYWNAGVGGFAPRRVLGASGLGTWLSRR